MRHETMLATPVDKMQNTAQRSVLVPHCKAHEGGLCILALRAASGVCVNILEYSDDCIFATEIGEEYEDEGLSNNTAPSIDEKPCCNLRT